MAKKRKKPAAALVAADAKKGRPNKAYCIEDAGRMVSLFDERRLLISSWWNAKTEFFLSDYLIIFVRLLRKFCTIYFSCRLSKKISLLLKRFELVASLMSSCQYPHSVTMSARGGTNWKMRTKARRIGSFVVWYLQSTTIPVLKICLR
jgi:hypothetical protein